MSISDCCVWDTRAFQVVTSAEYSTPRCCPTAHTLDGSADEMGDKVINEVAEVPVNPVYEDLHEKTVSVVPFSPREYNRKGIWLLSFQIDGVTNPLRVIPKKHEQDLIEFLKFKKCEYVAGLMTVANVVMGRFGAVEVDDLLEQQVTGLFLRKGFALAITDGHHRRSSIPNLTYSGEPASKCASQPIRKTLTKAPGFQLSTDHELLKLKIS